MLRFAGPASATGEDVAELHLHGGRSVVAAVLEALAAVRDLRPALPGEFTRRAFENGRIDLAEAEGLADLLLAETQSQRRAALALAGGALSRRIATWQRSLLGLAAEIEAVLDFSDEGEVGDHFPHGWNGRLADLIDEIEATLRNPPAERLRDGVRVVIAGPPNSGKSSLLNFLVGRKAAITSPQAGTTRDLIETPVALGGTPFIFVDTAGLRDSGDEIEAEGIDRARESIDTADIVLWLGDPQDLPAPNRCILVASKSDLREDKDLGSADIKVSSVTGHGMQMLVQLLAGRATTLLPQEGEVAINRRHRDALKSCNEQLRLAAAADDMIIAAELLRRARASLDQITGSAGVENMLDALFGSFCIGK
jgi:tRNA modification GTPase